SARRGGARRVARLAASRSVTSQPGRSGGQTVRRRRLCRGADCLSVHRRADGRAGTAARSPDEGGAVSGGLESFERGDRDARSGRRGTRPALAAAGRSPSLAVARTGKPVSRSGRHLREPEGPVSFGTTRGAR